VRFYEINPQVLGLASDPRYFQFLHDSAAPVDVVLGDGRLSLERELAQGASQDYDVLVVDAFNGDAVPVHLLTIEAFELYLRRLKPGGVLAMNVTNTFLDLRPVVVAAAERLGLASVWVHCDGDERVSYTNDWVLVSRDRQRIEAVASSAKHAAKLEVPESRLWTDDYSNLFEALRDKSRSSSENASMASP
jgi:spermidine synthase